MPKQYLLFTLMIIILVLKDFDARIISHEFDHLDKILYTDVAESVINIKGLGPIQLQNKILEALMQIKNK